MRRALCLCLVTITAACGDDGKPAGAGGAGAAGTAPDAGAGGVAGAGGAPVVPPPAMPDCGPGVCAEAILPPGYMALGPAVRYEAAPPGGVVRLPFSTDPTRASVVEVLVKRGSQPVFALAASALDLRMSPIWEATFRWDEPATFQLARKADALAPRMKRFTYRAMVGISMGGMGTGALAFRHPELFDAVGILGADPGVDLRYALAYIRDFTLGGFCDAASGRLGELCLTPARPLHVEEHEREEYFERLIFEEGDGTGLTLTRRLYMKALRDLTRAYGNPGFYNPASSYLPPGVPESWRQNPNRCAEPVVLERFFHARYNPDGALPVITFCDGGDRAPEFGVFAPDQPQTDPAEALLAVDVNRNGVRDSGEPVLSMTGEPWDDAGADGLPSDREPGYSPEKPDPAGDDYHYLKNPSGTEGNGRWDEGEPYEDTGVDGVMGRGCPAGSAAGCYDHGEADGRYTEPPNVLRWYEHSAPYLMERMAPAMRDRLDIWMDAGIRDFFNGHVASNRFLATLSSLGRSVRLVEGFPSLVGKTRDLDYDFQEVDWHGMGGNVYVRYGNPAATDAEIRMGDGRHVGTALQILHRVQSMFAWLSTRFPDGDRQLDSLPNENFMRSLSFVTSDGRETPYAVFLPPGYADHPDRRYPVIYFLHGYGQDPGDLIDLSALFGNYMVNPDIPEARRFQKFIIVYIDGRCRPGGSLAEVPAQGDGCEQGTFYTDSADGRAKMERAFLELMDHVDRTYRTKLPEDVLVEP